MEPSDEELLELMSQQFRDDLATVSRLASYGTPVEPGIYRVSLNTGALDFARAVLARFGNQPAPPAEGEVAELVAALRSQAIDCTCDHLTSGDLRRAADLLDRHHPAPVPVSERLPGPTDCDDEGTCWAWNRTAYTWGLFRLDLTAHSHRLPATALPLPAAEVQP